MMVNGHVVKVKVTREKCRKSLFPQCKNSISHNSDSIKYKAIDLRFACSMGFFAYGGSNDLTATSVT